MNRVWNRITLECYRQPGDTEKAPWYAYPLAALFALGWLSADIILIGVFS